MTCSSDHYISDLSVEARQLNLPHVRLVEDKELEHPDQKLDFYQDPLKSVWKNASGPTAMKSIEKQHVLDAISRIDSEDIPDGAQSTFYDLVHNEKRYPPKYVLSLAGEFANGRAFQKQVQGLGLINISSTGSSHINQ